MAHPIIFLHIHITPIRMPTPIRAMSAQKYAMAAIRALSGISSERGPLASRNSVHRITSSSGCPGFSRCNFDTLKALVLYLKVENGQKVGNLSIYFIDRSGIPILSRYLLPHFGFSNNSSSSCLIRSSSSRSCLVRTRANPRYSALLATWSWSKWGNGWGFEFGAGMPNYFPTWSKNNGMAKTGIPRMADSRIELAPAWEMNTRRAGWAEFEQFMNHNFKFNNS